MSVTKTLATLATAFALTAPVPGQAANWGAYLAASHADAVSDFKSAARYFSQALVQDPNNPALLESSVVAQTSLGQVDLAVPVARRLLQLGQESQIANLVLLADAADREAWDAILQDLEAGQSVGPLFDGLLRAWAELGAGRMTEAVAAFDEVIDSPGVKPFGLYHKALALATAGDFEGADAILSGGADGAFRMTGRAALARAEVLSHLERNDEALALLNSVFGDDADPAVDAVRAQLQSDEVLPLSIAASARDGVAEIFFSLASALNGEAADSYTLLYSRLAQYLRPDHIDALLLTAGLLERMERFDLATEAYREVPRDDPAYYSAELGRAAALNHAGKVDASIEVLRSLAETHADVPAVHVALGDMLRREERFAEAIKAYDKAIALYGEPEEADWVVYFARGISHEREDEWDAAEADFRTALDLRPDQPQVLNYLGYSYLELQQNYDEALDLIKRAVAAQPDSGYIVDSLGWAYYRMGRYEEAVEPLEKAAALMATDPIVNDHLGDAYWQVGRKLEAQFQWKRALSFDPEEKDAERIRRKLEVGLERALADEEKGGVAVANDR